MTKLEISRQINHTAKHLCRTIYLPAELIPCEGEIFNNLDKASSWQSEENEDGDGQSFISECIENGDIKVILECSSVPCHKVNYSNESECKILGATGCESECECVVPPEVKMKVKSIYYELYDEQNGWEEFDSENIENIDYDLVKTVFISLEICE